MCAARADDPLSPRRDRSSYPSADLSTPWQPGVEDFLPAVPTGLRRRGKQWSVNELALVRQLSGPVVLVLILWAVRALPAWFKPFASRAGLLSRTQATAPALMS